MSDKYVLVEHSGGINSIIQATFKTTQRIKFTAFDASAKYIIFGANSGGVYIFNREPCRFLKLIPSTHAPPYLIVISPDERNLAIAVSTGLIIILEDCFATNFQQQVFSEHENTTITALHWNGSDLYCGDSTGRVSVINFKSFLTKAIFQAPVACLMHLDSQIVQLDTFSKFLLVSTRTRSVLCDTDSAKFRQIGKKARDGSFGACFFNCGDESNVKIYCARPGARLWQADFDANVVVTHQFRSLLSQEPSRIIQSADVDELVVKTNEIPSGESFSFNKIFTLFNKLILTFTQSAFYIFEPSSCALLHWSPTVTNIKDIKIVDGYLYIWRGDLQITVLSLLTVEDIVLRSLVRRRYKLCAQICAEHLDDVVRSIGTSKRIHLLSALETKLDESELLNKLEPVFQRLKECAQIPKLEKFKNGIVTVMPVLPEPVLNFTATDDFHSILTEQFRVNKTHANVETSDFKKLIQTTDSDSFFNSLLKFNELVSEDADKWCRDVFLRHLTAIGDVTSLSTGALKYGRESFLEINTGARFSCKCNFPLPQAHSFVPKYIEIGHRLMQTGPDYENCTADVPYLYKFLLRDLEPVDIPRKVGLIVQFSDSDVVRVLSGKITYDVWDESIKCLIKLKSGQCVNCGANIDNSKSFTWRTFGILMVESIKPSNALKLLKRHNKSLPKGELDEFFYQYCIFSAATNVASCSNITNILQEDSVRKEFDTSVGGYLRKKYLRGDDYYVPPKPKQTECVSNCDQCQLPLNTQIIDEVERTSCGHNYHRVCFIFNNHNCPLCQSTFIK